MPSRVKKKRKMGGESGLFFNKFTEEEKEYLYEEDLENGMRLGCQMKIKKGEVTIKRKGNRAK